MGKCVGWLCLEFHLSIMDRQKGSEWPPCWNLTGMWSGIKKEKLDNKFADSFVCGVAKKTNQNQGAGNGGRGRVMGRGLTWLDFGIDIWLHATNAACTSGQL